MSVVDVLNAVSRGFERLGRPKGYHIERKLNGVSAVVAVAQWRVLGSKICIVESNECNKKSNKRQELTGDVAYNHLWT